MCELVAAKGADFLLVTSYAAYACVTRTLKSARKISNQAVAGCSNSLSSSSVTRSLENGAPSLI